MMVVKFEIASAYYSLLRRQYFHCFSHRGHFSYLIIIHYHKGLLKDTNVKCTGAVNSLHATKNLLSKGNESDHCST